MTDSEKKDPRQYPPGYEAADATSDGTEDEIKDPRQYQSDYTVADADAPLWKKYGVHGWTLAGLSPFIYLLLGFAFGWWAWAWVVIPVAGIIGTKMTFWIKCVSLAPFVYLLLGFAFGWWAWAWILIPVCGIISSGIYRRER